MGKRSKIHLQKMIVKLLSDGEVWTSRQLYDEVRHIPFKGPDSYQSFVGILGQMARFTSRRITETHEVIKVGEGRDWLPANSSSNGQGFGKEYKWVEYMLQERSN